MANSGEESNSRSEVTTKSSPSRGIRSAAKPAAKERPSERREVVITTGAAGNLGRLLVQALHRVDDVVAVDRREIRGLPKDVTHVRTDLRWRAIDNVFRTCDVRAVVHMG